jgi:streptogramin lyase
MITGSSIDMMSAFGSIWVSQPDRVARFDPATGHLIATIAVPGTSDFRNLAAGAGSIWVDDTGQETVTRIDPVRNRVTTTISMRANLFVVDGLAFVDGKLWVVRPVPNDEARGDVVSIDPATNRIAQRAIIPRTFDVMSSGTHALWYVRGTNLLRFDTTTLRASVFRRDVKVMLAATERRLWLLTPSGVIEADERTGEQIGSPIAVKDTVNLAAAIGPSAVWLAGQPDSSSRGNVTPYDLVTHRPLAAPTQIGFPIVTMTALPTVLWVDAGGITRIPYTR